MCQSSQILSSETVRFPKNSDSSEQPNGANCAMFLSGVIVFRFFNVHFSKNPQGIDFADFLRYNNIKER